MTGEDVAFTRGTRGKVRQLTNMEYTLVTQRYIDKLVEAANPSLMKAVKEAREQHKDARLIRISELHEIESFIREEQAKKDDLDLCKAYRRTALRNLINVMLADLNYTDAQRNIVIDRIEAAELKQISDIIRRCDYEFTKADQLLKVR